VTEASSALYSQIITQQFKLKPTPANSVLQP